MLSLASSLNSTLATQYVYTVGYPLMNQPNTGKFTYSVVNLTTAQPQFIFPSNSTLYLPMGFNRASSNVFINSSLTSFNVIRLQAKDTLFIKSNIDATSTQAILQEIYNTYNPDFSVINFMQNNIELNSKELLYKDNSFNFSITDEDNNLLDLTATKYVNTVSYPLMNYPNTGQFTYPVANLITAQPQIISPSTSNVYLPMGFKRSSINVF